MIWLIGPYWLSNISRQVEPATMGEITVGMMSSATKTCLSGIFSRKSCAISSPSTSSMGSAIARIRKVWPIDSQSRVSEKRAA